jgi:hypothetical protein
MNMNGWHWLTIAIVALAAYYIGAKYPAMVSRVGL